MEASLLIKSILGLVVILALLIFLFLFSPKEQKIKKSKKIKTVQSQKQKIDLNSLLAVIKNKNTSTKKLQETLKLILQHHGKIHKKLGVRVHPDFNIYKNIFIFICRHPNIDKNTIVNFDKELVKLNPHYKAEIDEALAKGLNARG